MPGWRHELSIRFVISAHSAHGLRVGGWSPTLGSVLGVEPAEDSLSPPASALLHPFLVKKKKKKKGQRISLSLGSTRQEMYKGALQENMKESVTQS